MATPLLNHDEMFGKAKDAVVDGLREFFPIVGKTKKLVLKDIQAVDDLDPTDFAGQEKAKLSGGTWGVPIHGHLELVDNVSGKVLDSGVVKLATLPKTTAHRFAHIVDGNEYQNPFQIRLKPGIYHRVKANDEIEAQINSARGQNLKIPFDRDTGIFKLQVGTSNIKLYPILRDLGVTDEQIEQHWGADVLRANQQASHGTAETEIQKLYKNLYYHEQPVDRAHALEGVKKYLETMTEFDPDVMHHQVGKKHSRLEPETLLLSTAKLLKIARGDDDGDDRDSIVVKNLHGLEDFLAERLKLARTKGGTIAKLQAMVDRKEALKDILSPNDLGQHITSFFTQTALSSAEQQINPLHMMSMPLKVTVHGEGGIQSEQAVTNEARGVHATHFGFLDPVQTPESHAVGAVLHASAGLLKEGNEMRTQAYDVRTGKKVALSPAKVHDSKIAFPDEFDKNLNPVGNRIRVLHRGDFHEVDPKDVDYVLATPKTMFSHSTNMIPFLGSTSGNRALTTAKMQEQALPLVNREAPLVQVKDDDKGTFEKYLGDLYSFRAPAAGVVTKVENGAVHIRSDGKVYKVNVYDNFPLNAKHFFHTDLKVKPGDTVAAGQLLGDTNYTQGGHLALGTNLRTMYAPWHGYNYEDGVVISESAAKRLTSMHMHKETIQLDDSTQLDRELFRAHYPGHADDSAYSKLDEKGLVRIGQKINPGELLATVLKKSEPTVEDEAIRGIHKSLVKPWKNRALHWEHDVPGEVVKIGRNGNKLDIYIRTEEPMVVGDKLAGRHGNKGIVTKILPDHEMPHDEEGNHFEIILNPMGTPSRMNLGQLMETAAGRIAKKTGKPFQVENFSPVNYVEKVRAALKEHGFHPDGVEKVYDPADGKPMGEVTAGYQYIMKLDHSVSKKLNMRNVAGYSSEGIPTRGNEEGSQAADPLFLYSMLSHGARENMFEMAAVKAERNDEYWRALQSGRPTPPPKPTFVFDKFLGLLKGLGVDVEKKGSRLVLKPLTDDAVLKQSAGAIKSAHGLLAKDLSEEPGGLFDPLITGGKGGSKWSHIDLPEPFPNPLFEDALKTVLGLDEKGFNAIMEGKTKVDGKEGGEALQALLARVNVPQRLEQLKAEAPNLSGQELNKAHKEIRYLEALQRNGLSPDKAYVLTKLPVIPPKFRPIYPLPDGNLLSSDLNYLYKDTFLNGQKLAEAKGVLPDEDVARVRTAMYQYMQGLYGLASAPSHRDYKGILDIVRGTSQSKEGLFQAKLVSRRQDLTARSTIVVEPNMAPDEIGIPEEMAWTEYKPFVVRRLVAMGLSPLAAEAEVEKKSAAALTILQKELEHRPVMANRAPSLHRHSVMAFKPKIVSGKAIKLHPLVTAGFSADFDGDTMSIHVPIGEKAREEAFKMMPTNNTLNPGTGKLMLMPSQEAVVGLFMLTGKGRETSYKFPSIDAATAAVKRGMVTPTDVVTIGKLRTTVGRYLYNELLPHDHRDYETQVTKGTLTKTLSKVLKSHSKDFGGVVNSLKDLGNAHATKSGYTITLGDIRPLTKERDQILAAADRVAATIRKMPIADEAKRLKIIDAYNRATDQIDELLKKQDISKNGLLQSVASGARGDWTQVRQVVAAPMLLRGSGGRIVATPARRSYAEGLSTADYFIQSFGARAGAVDRSKQTSVPGYFAKRLINANLDQVVTAEDDPNDPGIPTPVDSTHALDRFLAEDYPGVAKRGDLITQDVLTALKRAGHKDVQVMSPLTSTLSHGVSAKAVGLMPGGKLPAIGDNVGVTFAQSMSEPATQLQMKTFHTGGAAKGGIGANLASGMQRVLQLFEMPDVVPGAGTLATLDGKVERVDQAPQGGHYVVVGGVRHYVPATRELTVKPGDQVQKGQLITDGVIRPQDLLMLKGMRAVQDYLVDEILKVYADQGVNLRRVVVETAIRPLTNLARVRDPGDLGDQYVPGDYAPLHRLEHHARSGKKVEYEPVIKGINTLPLFSNEDWLAQLNFKDLKKVVQKGASMGWSSDIHGTHPIPAYVHGAEFGKGGVVPGSY